MATYGDIKAQFSGLLNRRNATDDMVNGFLQSGIQRINREIRCPEMEEIQEMTVADGFTGIAVPANFIELIDILNNDGQRLSKEDITRVKFLAKNEGFPEFYYRLGTQWIIGPAPRVGDNLTTVYYKTLSPLVDDTDTNELTSAAPDLIVYAGLGFAADFFTDSRAPNWESRYQQIAQSLQQQTDADELSGAATVSPSWVWPSDSPGYGWTDFGPL